MLLEIILTQIILEDYLRNSS